MKNLLFIGWFNVPHSYAIVNCNQILALKKKYGNEYNFYKLEYPYPENYKDKWNNLEKKNIYKKEDINIINSIPNWKNEKIDLIYSITYPYDLNIIIPNVPKVIFFTAEYGELTPEYFNLDTKILDDEKIIKWLEKNTFLHFTSPSIWSKDSLKKYNRTNEIISHGIDSDIFKFDRNNRKNIRKMYGIKNNETVFLNLGSMTGNKGIIELFISLTICVCRLNMKHIKLILKGMNDLYNSENFVISYMKETFIQNILKKEEVDYMLENNVIFFNNTLTFKNLANIYNACDVYISPYKAEGFNLTVLESLACGMDIIVSDNGSTKFFVDDIINNCETTGIHLLPTNLNINPTNNLKNLSYSINDLIKIIHENYREEKNKDEEEKKNVESRIKYIHNNYSWENTADKLHQLFKKLIVKI